MEQTIEEELGKKAEKDPIYQTVGEALVRQIRSGKLHSGDRVPSERDLANLWGISRGTARLALKELETLGYVERQGVRGTFIRSLSGRIRNVVLAFPEELISPEILAPECWALSSELHRGLMFGASKLGMKVFFEHFKEEVSATERREQLHRLHRYDAAVFASPQLIELQKDFAAGHAVIQITGWAPAPPTDPSILLVRYEKDSAVRKLVAHFRQCGCAGAGVVSFLGPEEEANILFLERGERFLSLARKEGLSAPEEFHFKIDLSRGNAADALDPLFRRPLPEAIFCNHAEKIVDFYKAASRNRVQIGKDILVAGIATGLTFQGLLPSCTYVRVPMFEIGVRIMEVLAENPHPEAIPLVEAPLVIGQSTRRADHLPETGKESVCSIHSIKTETRKKE